MTNPVLHREQLDDLVGKNCTVPNCTNPHHESVFIHGVCHTSGGVEVCYNKLSRSLEITCAVCHKPVVTIAIKSEKVEHVETAAG